VAFGRNEHCSEADLSALLDGQLGAGARERCDAHLAACPSCAEALEGLRTVRSSLRALPRATAPRSFRVRPVQVEVTRSRRPAFIVRVMPQLTGLSIASAVAFFALIAANAGSFDSRSSSFDGASPNLNTGRQESAADSAASPLPQAVESGAESPPGRDSFEGAEVDGTAYIGGSPVPDAATNDLGAGQPSGTTDEPVDAYDATAQARAPSEAPAAEEEDDAAGDITLRSDNDSNTGIYIAMSVAAAVSLTTGGLAFAAWRQRR
jgi:hypothetical protein